MLLLQDLQRARVKMMLASNSKRISAGTNRMSAFCSSRKNGSAASARAPRVGGLAARAPSACRVGFPQNKIFAKRMESTRGLREREHEGEEEPRYTGSKRKRN